MPLFKGLAKEIIAALCLTARPMVAIKSQEIVTEGQPGREMFILLSGEVEVTQRGKRLGFLSDGAFFGENPVLADGSSGDCSSTTCSSWGVGGRCCGTGEGFCDEWTMDVSELPQ